MNVYIFCGKSYFEKFQIIPQFKLKYNFFSEPRYNFKQQSYYIAMMNYLNLEQDTTNALILKCNTKKIDNLKPLSKITCQCIFINQYNDRCTERSQYAPLCTRHAKEVYGVEIKVSHLGGKGLFLSNDISTTNKQTPLLPYLGIWDDNQITSPLDLYTIDYSDSQYGETFYIRGERFRSYGAMINHSNKPNSQIVQIFDKIDDDYYPFYYIYLLQNQTFTNDQELLIDYGISYGDFSCYYEEIPIKIKSSKSSKSKTPSSSKKKSPKSKTPSSSSSTQKSKTPSSSSSTQKSKSPSSSSSSKNSSLRKKKIIDLTTPQKSKSPSYSSSKNRKKKIIDLTTPPIIDLVTTPS